MRGEERKRGRARGEKERGEERREREGEERKREERRGGKRKRGIGREEDSYSCVLEVRMKTCGNDVYCSPTALGQDREVLCSASLFFGQA